MFKTRNLILFVGLFLLLAAAFALRASPAVALAPAGFTETPTSPAVTVTTPPTVLPPGTPTRTPLAIRPPRNRPPIGPNELPVTGEPPGGIGLSAGAILGIALIAAIAGFAIGLGGKRFLAWLASRGIGGFLS